MVIKTPNRNVLAVVAHGDQQTMKFFEDLAETINNAEASLNIGSGGLMDMGDRMETGSIYDGGARV